MARWLNDPKVGDTIADRMVIAAEKVADEDVLHDEQWQVLLLNHQAPHYLILKIEMSGMGWQILNGHTSASLVGAAKFMYEDWENM